MILDHEKWPANQALRGVGTPMALSAERDGACRPVMKRFSAMKVPALVGWLLVGAAGCSGSATSDSDAFSTTASAIVTSDAKIYRVALYSAPDPRPTRGSNSFRLVITKVADGFPATGLDVGVVPWMPAMGHGASFEPSVIAGDEPGSYVATHVNLFMSGLWELRTSIGGDAGDHATAAFDIQ